MESKNRTTTTKVQGLAESENQENKATTSSLPGTPTGRVLKHGLDKLSLNSPRSPLGLLNVKTESNGSELTSQMNNNSNGSSNSKGFIKRKFLSVRAFGSTNRAKTASMDSGFGSGGYRSFGFGSEGTPSSMTSLDCPAGPVNNDEGDGYMLDLLSKPILRPTCSPIKEECEPTSKDATPKKVESFKRPSMPMDEERERQRKRARSSVNVSYSPSTIVDQVDEVVMKDTQNTSSSSKFLRTQSESALGCSIMCAVERINSDPNLLGDGSRKHLLPILERGKHSDLKEISPAILASLMQGDYREDVQGFEIVDCRYPYEFSAGHIISAVNLFTRRQIYERFFGTKKPKHTGSVTDPGKRNIVVFHCEFSSQRGPDMCRWVRDCDRKMNDYPLLHYPEIYVLHGGYKAFFETYKAMCMPQVYLPMVHEKYSEECRYYKNQSKTDVVSFKKVDTQSEGKLKPPMRSSMKKLNLEDL